MPSKTCSRIFSSSGVGFMTGSGGGRVERQVLEMRALPRRHAQRPPADREIDRRRRDERDDREQRGGVLEDESFEHEKKRVKPWKRGCGAASTRRGGLNGAHVFRL